MNKTAIIVVGIILLLTVIIAPSSSHYLIILLIPSKATVQGNTIQIVVVGHINMGPMQPTVDAIKEVTSKYGDSINVTWIDMLTQDGAEYANEHGLTAHMNVVINGFYEYDINSKIVTFQWFEGQQWTKDDLDTIISSLLNKDNRATPISNQDNRVTIITIASYAIVIVVMVVAAWLILRRLKK